MNVVQKTQFIERMKRSFNEHYNNLSPVQWDAVYHYSKFGYVLEFVRVDEYGQRSAFLNRDGQYILVNNEGTGIVEPNVIIRA